MREDDFPTRETVAVDLATATINELQDTYLWDWVDIHLGMVAHLLGMKHGGEALQRFLDVRGGSAFLLLKGGSFVLVEWILKCERVLKHGRS